MSAPRPPVTPPTGVEQPMFSFLRAVLSTVYHLWNSVGRPYSPTAAETTITHTAPGSADYAIQDLTNGSPYGFVTKDEGNTFIQVVANLQARVTELEVKLGSGNQ